ncbi:MAG: methyltransferase [Alphaproteobacteria bacterium]|nr:methyltransferase [Alphaproteobacteria bacterium]
MISCWKARAVLPKLDAQRLVEMLEALDPAPPAVSSFELGERGLWEVEAFFTTEPNEAELVRAVGAEMRIIPVMDENWVARALEGLPPVRAGRFFIHGSHSTSEIPANAIALRIEASYAFGTGHHGTTRGCLLAYDALSKRRRFKNALDLGCGTGVLAMAYSRTEHRLAVATDIDALAVDKTRENAKLNRAAPYLRIAAGNGFRAAHIAGNAPYDLIFANILAGPLMKLMPGIRKHLAPRGNAILSGLLDEQANAVLAMARAHGLRLVRRSALEGWITLILER